MGVLAKDGQVKIPLLWECKDGSVAFFFWVGPNFVEHNTALVEWIRESGVDPGKLGEWNWKTDGWNKYTMEEVKQIRRTMEEFFMRHTKMELHEGALERRIQLTPVLTPKDLLEFELFKERGYWREIEYPELDTKITYPGGFVKAGIGDCGVRCRAPLIGENNDAILHEEMGISTEDMVNMKQRRVI